MTNVAFPLRPPADWFTTPESDGPTPLTFEKTGRVYGHLALWDSCHAGLLNGSFSECVRPPQSKTAYRSFHLGELETADGGMVPVGKIVYAADHAPLTAGLEGATRHYDNTGSVGAFVHARNGKHGIWLAGAVRSDLSPEGLRDLRANPPSGDWRMLNHNLELIASLSVPVPGYQIPRAEMALAASAEGLEVSALILAGYTGEEDGMGEERDRAYVRQRSIIKRELQETALTAAVLTAKKRKSLPARDFAIPETREYPIYDEDHARNALARSSGKPVEGRVRRAVCRRYPDMGECKAA